MKLRCRMTPPDPAGPPTGPVAVVRHRFPSRPARRSRSRSLLRRRARWHPLALVTAAGIVVAGLGGCSMLNDCLDPAGCESTSPTTAPSPATSAARPAPTPSVTASPSPSSSAPAPEPAPAPAADPASGTVYPTHTGIVATTFWVGEIFDPNASDGSQVLSTYDGLWMQHYGGCDGISAGGVCETEPRSAANAYFPTAMTPRENPFYLDLPFDDINDPAAFARRDSVVPWAGEEPYRSHAGDNAFSYLKNRWVALTFRGSTCYAQIEDAGPGEYNDAAYVFGADDRRPLNARYDGAGMDVSPAVVGCLGFDELNGTQAGVSWAFVDDAAVPTGPWTQLVTTSQVR